MVSTSDHSPGTESHLPRYRPVLPPEPPGPPVRVEDEIKKKPEGAFYSPVVLGVWVDYQSPPDRSPPVFVCGHSASVVWKVVSSKDGGFDVIGNSSLFCEKMPISYHGRV